MENGFNMGHVNRPYQRGIHFHTEAKYSTDGKTWITTTVTDLSSSGMLLDAENQLEKGSELWLDLIIHGFFSEFEIKVKGVIKREVVKDNKYSYGIAFVNLPPDLAIRIDENVRNDRPVGGTPYYGE